MSDTGNTKAVSHKKHRNWFFTWNNYTRENVDTILTKFRMHGYAMQEEEGKEGTPHLQGVILLRNANSFSAMKKIMPGAHIEKAWNKQASIKYCTKEETRVGKRWTHNVPVIKKCYDIVKHKGAYPWQQCIIDMIKGPADSRKIIWIHEAIGNTGKSALCKHLILEYKALIVGGSAKDAMFGIASRIKEGYDVNIVCFDIPRSSYNKVSYTAMEAIKNGMFFSSKYESNQCVFDIPHMIVFCNFEPNYLEMSMDRWEVIKLG